MITNFVKEQCLNSVHMNDRQSILEESVVLAHNYIDGGKVRLFYELNPFSFN